MATLTEIIANEQAYPGDVKFTMPDGTVVSMDDLRRDYRSKDADYRQKTSRVAEERRALQEKEAAMQASYLEAENKLAEWTKQLMQANPGMSQREAQDQLEDDPRYAKLTKRFETLESTLGEKAKKIEDLEKQLAMDQKARLVQAHQYTLAQLKQTYGDFDAEELVQFAQMRGIPRLDDAYYVKHRDELIASERKKAVEEEAPKLLAKAKAELSQPMLPTTRLVRPNAEKATNLDAALDQALSDPEIMGPLTGSTPVF